MDALIMFSAAAVSHQLMYRGSGWRKRGRLRWKVDIKVKKL